MRLIIAAILGTPVCVWTWWLGSRARKQAIPPEVITRHPAAHRTHPETPGLPVDGEPLNGDEKRALREITGVGA